MRTYAVAVALLFIALAEPSFAQTERALEVAEGAPLLLECPLRVEQAAGWRLDGRAPPPDLVGEERAGAAGLTARLAAPAAAPHHAGLYTCAGGAARLRLTVAPRRPPGTSEAPAASAAPVDVVEPQVFFFDLARPFKLNCSTGVAVVDDAPYTWTVNGSALGESALGTRVSLEAGGRTLAVSRATDGDHGDYACAARGATLDTWRLAARAHAKLPSDSSVVEGQNLKLACKLIGRPPPPVAWYYTPEGGNATDAAEAFPGRVTLTAEGGVAELALAGALRSDAGNFTCAPAHGVPDSTVLRVKDMYAALWPFLGICAEVFVLCAVILVYEKRRTKPELDDSDTDNHDQ